MILPFLEERLASEKFGLICMVFIFNVPHIQRSVCFDDCNMCCLFGRENLASPYKCSNVELIYSACVTRKHFFPVRSTT